MDLQQQRRRLTEMQGQLEKRSNEEYRENLRDYHHELSVTDNHPADVASEDYLRNLDASFQENDQLLLEKIQKALVRIDHGEYEDCTECGAKIDPKRLEALPYAATCAECANREAADPGKSRSYPDEGDFTWPKFNQYGTASGAGEQPRPDQR
ncbi:MAG: TraR/DksA C4-type zinc finger protein [Eubacteriales bacterium]|nr:TraR/DksA C4-type zinc finger protein [Eubacteriales bacterium]